MKFHNVGFALMVALLFGCSEQKDDRYFTLEEANECLLASDKSTVLDCVEWIKKAEATKDKKKFDECFEKAHDPVRELYVQSLDDDSPKGRKRSAALAYVLIDFTYNHYTGSCAKWVLSAQRLGLIEAHRMVADPPEKLRGYLLPPDQQ